jgi:acyl-CoA carboxylase epsilon subunit-like protein
VNDGVRVHGNATAEELGAVLAVLAAGAAPPAPAEPYARWREGRRAALIRHPEHPPG